MIAIDENSTQFNGKWLHIHLRPVVDFEFRISSWTQGLVVQPWYGPDDEEDQLEIFDPNIDIFNPSNYKKGSPILKWIQTIPSNLINLIHRFELNQLTMLRLIHANSRVQELLTRNPVLFSLFTHFMLKNEIPVNGGAMTLNLRRTTILESIIGRRCTESDVKFINKFEADRFNQEELEILFRAVADKEIVSNFSHIQSVSKSTLKMSFDYPDFMDSKLVHYLSIIPDRIHEVRRLWIDSMRMGRQLQIPNYPEIIRKCKTLENLERLHDRWSRRLYLPENLNSIRDVNYYGTKDFPPPPIKGNQSIFPIENVEDLFEEGQKMNHCVWSYAENVFERRSYIYKVIDPERATLELVCRNGKWTIGGFKLANNRHPSVESRNALQKWFGDSFQKSGE